MTIVVVVVGAIFGIFAIGLTSYYAKKELNRVIEAREAAEKEAAVDGDVEEQREAARDGDQVAANSEGAESN